MGAVVFEDAAEVAIALKQAIKSNDAKSTGAWLGATPRKDRPTAIALGLQTAFDTGANRETVQAIVRHIDCGQLGNGLKPNIRAYQAISASLNFSNEFGVPVTFAP